ncbi:MAG: GNAT family N-acetyltransferase [Oscillospiraceae bacterium]|jgi:GNAT superfamily N-acetyltransferase|nr:GNAT family N-acetyltransferase [Oscillospiraceae bacterium]
MSDVITLAHHDDVPVLQDLYAAAFGALEWESELFFSMRFVPEDTLVFRRDGKILAALYLWYGELVCAGQRYPTDYIYAAATYPDARRQGIMTRLIEAATELSLKRDRRFLTLYPANENLYAYYAKKGFITAFYCKELTLKRDMLSLIADKHATAPPITNCPSADMLYTLRETLFARADGFSWNAAALNYAIAYLKDEGQLIAVEQGGSLCAYCFIKERGSNALLVESVVQPGAFPALAAEILRVSSAGSFRFILPPDFPLSADGFVFRPAGMLRPLTKEGETAAKLLHNAYLGLPLT